MSLINYKVSTIQLKNKQGKVINGELKEFCSVTLPYELINYIYLFMPKHPLAEIVTTGIINVKNRFLEIQEKYIADFIQFNRRLINEPYNQFELNKKYKMIENTLISIIPTIHYCRRCLSLKTSLNLKKSKIQMFYEYKEELNRHIKLLQLDTIKTDMENATNVNIRNEKIWKQQGYFDDLQYLRIIRLQQRNILPEYTREKRRKKVGSKIIFEKSQKDYFKRKGIKNGIMVEYQKRIRNTNRVSILNN